MNKKLVFISFCTLFALRTWAQGEMRFEVETYDFGTIVEGNIAEYDFVFSNVGNAPVIISNVNASCGCTTPYYTKDPIMPKSRGSIKASYNSNGRPGVFHKTITVTSNASTPTKILAIKGNVVKKEDKKVYSAEEISASAILQLQKDNHGFGKVERGQRVVTRFNLQNTGKSELKMMNIESSCSCVNYKMSPMVLKPGEEGVIEFYYQPRSLGEQAERVKLLSNDITKEAPVVILKASVVESLNNQSPMRERNDNPFK
jgi:hypothetical protein